MKKILSLIGIVSLGSAGVSSVVACGNKSSDYSFFNKGIKLYDGMAVSQALDVVNTTISNSITSTVQNTTFFKDNFKGPSAESLASAFIKTALKSSFENAGTNIYQNESLIVDLAFNDVPYINSVTKKLIELYSSTLESNKTTTRPIYFDQTYIFDVGVAKNSAYSKSLKGLKLDSISESKIKDKATSKVSFNQFTGLLGADIKNQGYDENKFLPNLQYSYMSLTEGISKPITNDSQLETAINNSTVKLDGKKIFYYLATLAVKSSTPGPDLGDILIHTSITDIQ